MKKIFSNFAVLLFVFFFSSLTFSQTTEKAGKIDELLNKYAEYGLFNGSVLVSENGNVILAKGYGYSNIDSKIECTPETKFRIGSITKQFTSMLVMQLVEKGKIKLDGKLSDYLTYYRKDNGDKITVHHLLTHTAGIPNYTNDRAFMETQLNNKFTPKELIEKYCSGNLEFDPGTNWNYSNSGYIILGAIIEEVTGKKYEDVLKESILIPLEMNNTGYEHNEIKMTNQAIGYDNRPDGVIVSKFIDMTIPFAAGAMYSTVEDLYKWDRTLYTDKLISNELKEKMFTPFLKNYAYGWGIAKANANGVEKTIYTHSGGINGFNANIARFVSDNSAIIILSNFYNAQSQKISNEISKILYGIPYNFPAQPLLTNLINQSKTKGLKDAVAEAKELAKDKTKYSYDEGSINNYGYVLLQSGKTDDAIEIFKLNVELFPASANVYDSLGEAFMNKGDKENALINYKKSLKFNPNNQGAKDAIKKMEGK